MKTTFGGLWRSEGTIGRGMYAVVGLFGFALKHNLDRFVATYGFYRPWGLFNYWVPVRDVARITSLGSDEARFLATMVALSLPFIWIGVVLTMKRLRSAGLSTQLVALFFLPVLNLFFFLVLCLVPEREVSSTASKTMLPQDSSLARILPESAMGSAAVSLLLTVPVALGVALLGVQVLENYGWGLFVALPFTLGFAAAFIYGFRRPRSLMGCVGVACLSVALLGAALMALALEGVICLIMATPIALPLAAFGGLCGYQVRRRRFQTDSRVLISALLLFAPGVEWLEHLSPTQPPTFVVRTSLDIQAPPEKVWQQVVAFSEIAPPTEWMFRAGIAYPIRAEMLGRGSGAEGSPAHSVRGRAKMHLNWNHDRRR